MFSGITKSSAQGTGWFGLGLTEASGTPHRCPELQLRTGRPSRAVMHALWLLKDTKGEHKTQRGSGAFGDLVQRLNPHPNHNPTFHKTTHPYYNML